MHLQGLPRKWKSNNPFNKKLTIEVNHAQKNRNQAILIQGIPKYAEREKVIYLKAAQ